MTHKGAGLKVYIRPGFSKAGAVKKAIGTLNNRLGGQAYTVTKKRSEANITVRGAKKGSEAYSGGMTSRTPKGYGEARAGKTKIVLSPKGYAGEGKTKPVNVMKTAAHELQHAAGVKHSQMVGGKRKGDKPVPRTGTRFTKKSKAKAQRVTGLKPHH